CKGFYSDVLNLKAGAELLTRRAVELDSTSDVQRQQLLTPPWFGKHHTWMLRSVYPEEAE
ncbi:hypothetical protein ScPMuIL_011837, partial [Solemya velum]